ncbi:hypothetical protein BMF94_6664 [Rhodotorula taiwanensis]|uniref:Uncharacterized protein n=1 Tax=Rhodotorula taiwanensis TaxID=741276 RepID=A0A2S5B0T1_9BASI|nr:hypothetical protein BMF94_6664 [Rhodotorula taiwanensis]
MRSILADRAANPSGAPIQDAPVAMNQMTPTVGEAVRRGCTLRASSARQQQVRRNKKADPERFRQARPSPSNLASSRRCRFVAEGVSKTAVMLAYAAAPSTPFAAASERIL